MSNGSTTSDLIRNVSASSVTTEHYRLKDGKEVELIARIRVTSRVGEGKTQTHELIIDAVETTDQGTYTCVVSNDLGEELCTAKLEVIGVWRKIDIYSVFHSLAK